MISKTKVCQTVGDLISELKKLPKSRKLSEPSIVVEYNTGENAKEHNLKPCVAINDYE